MLYLAVANLLEFVNGETSSTEYEAQMGGEAILESLLPLIKRDRCECSDAGCAVDHGCLSCCPHKATTTVQRTDMEDETTTFRFCEGCAEDALESGVFA